MTSRIKVLSLTICFKAFSLEPLNPWTLGPLSSTKSLGDDPYV